MLPLLDFFLITYIFIGVENCCPTKTVFFKSDFYEQNTVALGHTHLITLM